MASLYVYLVFIVCYLPNICVLNIIANIGTNDRSTAFAVLYTDPVVCEFNP